MGLVAHERDRVGAEPVQEGDQLGVVSRSEVIAEIDFTVWRDDLAQDFRGLARAHQRARHDSVELRRDFFQPARGEPEFVDAFRGERPVVVVFECRIPAFDRDRMAHDKQFHRNLQGYRKCSI